MNKLKAIGLKFKNKVILLTTVANVLGILVQLGVIDLSLSGKILSAITVLASFLAQIGILTTDLEESK
jgi:hypothetical protein